MPQSKNQDFLKQIILITAMFIAALVLRMYGLTLRPLHHDESVNGWFVDKMLREGYYNYDPSNYHGPIYFYLLSWVEYLFGRNEWALRLPSVLFGVLTVFSPFVFLRWVTFRTAAIASFVFLISPAEVFFSRYAIHEMFFAFVQIVFVYFWFKATEAKTTDGSNNEFKIWAMALGLAFGFLAGLKENFVVFGAALFVADLIAFGKNRFLFWFRLIPWMMITAIPTLVVSYTGFFRDGDGINNFFAAFALWSNTGVVGNGHSKPFYYWLNILFGWEMPMALGVCVAVLISAALFIQRSTYKNNHKRASNVKVSVKDRFVSASPWIKFLSVLGLVHLAIYSLISYKTPWCLLSWAWPFAFVSGYFIDQFWPKAKIRQWGFASFLCVLFHLISGK